MSIRPYPGDDLAARVSGLRDREQFWSSGQRSVEEMSRVVALAGRAVGDCDRVLDFGCGCGRMLLWLDAPAGRRIDAVDVDHEAIGWVQQHLPHVDARVNEPMPPLPYPDATFDLVYNHSVFTHIDEGRQDAWLAELRRVTRPGGLVVLTVHGEAAFGRYEDDNAVVGIDSRADRRTLQREGILFVARGRQHGFPEWYATTYHTTQYVFHRWSRWFTVLAYVRQGALDFQDLVLLRRPGDREHDDPYLRWASEPGVVREWVRRSIERWRPAYHRVRAATARR